MTRRIVSLAMQVFACLLLISANGLGQSQDRSRIEKDIEALREQLKEKENELLSPSAEDRARYAEFLLQRDTGLARLLPREKYREKLSIREGGAYYSFTKQSNSYDRDPQISLEQEYFNTGFFGANFGFLASLGDIPLESIGIDDERVQYLGSFVAPTTAPEAREQQRRSGSGFDIGRTRYKGRLPVIIGGSYLLRSIGYDRFDVLVAFQVVRLDSDGSLILRWKKLREFSTPFLTRP